MAVTFGGRTTRIPSVIPNVDTSGLVRGGITGSGIVGIIGTAEAGTEDTVQTFRLPSNARTEYRGGPLLDVADAAWGHGAQIVKMLRVGSGLSAASTTLSASGGGGETELTITSIEKGETYNDIQVKVETVGAEPSRKITIQFYDSDNNRTTTETFTASSTTLLAAAINTPTSAGGSPSDLVTATVGASATEVLNTSSYVSLTGGSDGTINNTVVTNALALFETEDVNIIIFDEEVTDSTAHALAKSHCVVMSGQDRERICIVGHALGDDVGDTDDSSSIIGQAYGLNSDRAVLVSPGTDGRSAAYTAAKVAGLLAKIEVAEPLTFKGISASTIETSYSRTELEDLIQYGVCAIEDSKAGRRVIRGITTVQDPSSVTEDSFKEISVRRVVDLIVDTIRTNMEATYIGKRGVTGIENSMAGSVQSLLLRLKENQTITNFRGIDVQRDSLRPDAFTVSFEVAPTFPINFILVDFKLQNVI